MQPNIETPNDTGLCYIGTLERAGLLNLFPAEKLFVTRFAQTVCFAGPFPETHTSIGVHYLRMQLKARKGAFVADSDIKHANNLLALTKGALRKWYA